METDSTNMVTKTHRLRRENRPSIHHGTIHNKKIHKTMNKPKQETQFPCTSCGSENTVEEIEGCLICKNCHEVQ